MNKKKKGERAQVVSVTIPPDLLKKSQTKAFINNKSYSAYVVNCIKKDEPIEPIYYENYANGEYNPTVCECGNSLLNYGQHYCDGCGQALKWLKRCVNE